eukprot:2077159-Rhodomonas_salina.1
MKQKGVQRGDGTRLDQSWSIVDCVGTCGQGQARALRFENAQFRLQMQGADKQNTCSFGCKRTVQIRGRRFRVQSPRASDEGGRREGGRMR